MTVSGTEFETGDNEELTRDQVYDLLSSHRRRYALHATKRADGPVDISWLAEQVAAWENSKALDQITSSERHRVYTSIQQTHLPAMDRAGIIEFDNGTVRLTEEAEQLDVYMDVVPSQSIPWGQYYLGLSVFAVGLLAGVGVGVFPSVVPTLAWAAGIVALFLVSSAFHVWQSRGMRLGASDVPPEVDR